MAKESIAKENAVVDALRRLKEEEAELQMRIKPVQEAIVALEKIVEKSVKKVKASSGTKEGNAENANTEEIMDEAGIEA